MAKSKTINRDRIHLDLPRHYDECRMGESDFKNGRPISNCPFPMGDERRKRWMTGWYDARTRKRLGHIFERWRLQWP